VATCTTPTALPPVQQPAGLNETWFKLVRRFAKLYHLLMQGIFGFYKILHHFMFWFCYFFVVGKRDDPGLESRLGYDFSQPSRPVLGLTQPPVNGLPGLSPG
jgi:hypothetical protein